MKIQQPKSQRQRQRWDFLFQEPTFGRESELGKLAQKLRKSQLIETNFT